MALSQSQAYRRFSDLLKKSRPPESQKKVDEIIDQVSDIHKRIELIEDLDAGVDTSNRGGANKKKPVGSALRGSLKDSRKQRPDTSTGRERGGDKAVRKGGGGNKKKPAAKDKDKEGGGLFGIFRRLNKLARFARSSDAIATNIIGGAYRISEGSRRLFQKVPEGAAIDTLKALKVTRQSGWKVMRPAGYNASLDFEVLLNEYLLVAPTLSEDASGDFLYKSTLPFIRQYLKFHRNPEMWTHLEDGMAIVFDKSRKLAAFRGSFQNLVRFFRSANSKQSGLPTMTEFCQGIFCLKNERYVSFEEILEFLKTPPFEENKFKGPPDVMQDINRKVDEFESGLKKRKQALKEIEQLFANYFSIRDGKFDFSFLRGMLTGPTSEAVVESLPKVKRFQFGEHPGHLLYFILTDFRLTYFNLLEGVVPLSETKDSVKIFASEVFKEDLNELVSKMNDLKQFLSKYPNHFLSFLEFRQILNGENDQLARDQINQNLIEIIQKTIPVLKQMAQKLRIVIENHRLAREYQDKGQLDEDVRKTRGIVINEITRRHRFLPYYDSVYQGPERVKGQTIEKIMEDLVFAFHNYLAIFREESVIQKFASISRLKNEIAAIDKEYERFRYQRKSSPDGR